MIDIDSSLTRRSALFAAIAMITAPRITKSKAVGALFGLTPKKYQW